LKTRLQREDKKHQKTREISNVLTMVINTTADIMFRFQDAVQQIVDDQPTRMKTSIEILNEIDEIVKYSNECFEDIAKTFVSKQLRLNPNLRLVRA
jgi:hypothetical protein